jgi:hypothetical protein
MSYTEMVEQNRENKAIADAARSASQQKQIMDAQVFGEQTGADIAISEIEALLSQIQEQENINYPTQGLAGTFVDSAETVSVY